MITRDPRCDQGLPVRHLDHRLPVWTKLSRRKGHGCPRPSLGKEQRPHRGRGTSKGPHGRSPFRPRAAPRLKLRRWPGPPGPGAHVLCPHGGHCPCGHLAEQQTRCQHPGERSSRPRRGRAGPDQEPVGATGPGAQASAPLGSASAGRPQGSPFSADHTGPGPGGTGRG